MLVHITVDGTRLTVPQGSNVLQCALDAGIYIPHLCHHKDLTPLGGCRLCVVALEGEDRPVPSCMLKAEEGMVLTTRSEALDELRRLALELLLTCHPEDCSTCPKFGNCELQTLLQYIGPKTGRLKHRSKGFPVKGENPLLLHDPNRCVLCTRCVRACQELRGVGVLDIRKKGSEFYVGTLHEKLLMDADCRFCGACAQVCPTGAIMDQLPPGRESWTREERQVPCKTACPAHTEVPRYVRYVKEGKYEEAAAVVREKVPLPLTLGYVCSHPCEAACRRGELTEPVAIRDIKRHAAQQATGRLWRGKGKQLPATGKRICVVGGGPAGLTAAYYLSKQGHQVVLKEALPKLGGMLRYGIPAYRLPRAVLDGELLDLLQSGIEVRLGERVENPRALLEEYDAALLATGCHRGVRLPIPGKELPGVLENIPFLRNCSQGSPTGMGRRVVVLGGGNVAFDCARSAVRLGAEAVAVACLEDRDHMTADPEEIRHALQEGVTLYPGRSFEAICGQTAVTGVELMEVEEFSFDENRRAVIRKRPGSTHCLEADTVIFAVGQRPEQPFLAALGGAMGGSLSAIATELPGLFAAGDGVYGTQSVIQAIAAGRLAAQKIDRYLGGDGDISEVFAPVEKGAPYLGQSPGFAYQHRHSPRLDSPQERRTSFRPYDQGIPDPCAEAGRCLQCDLRLDISGSYCWSDFGKEARQ